EGYSTDVTAFADTPPSGGLTSRGFARPAPSPLVDLVAQPLAGLELGLLRRGDLDLFAGARVASLGRRASGHREGAEPNETNLAASLQRAGDRLKYRVNRLVCSRFGQISLTGDGIDEFVSIHVWPPKRFSDIGTLRSSPRSLERPPQPGQRRSTGLNRGFADC